MPTAAAKPPSDVAELLRPTLANAADAGSGSRPWRVDSQIWVALFGGALAPTAIAYLNGRRLGNDPGKQRLMLVVGALGLALAVVVNYLLGLRENAVPPFLANQVVGVITWVGLYRLQRTADRVYDAYGSGERESLLAPGIAAAVGLGIVQIVVVAMIISAIGG